MVLPEPAGVVDNRYYNMALMGIGGTGVVTVNQVLGTAALLDGKHVRGLDQTGLSQKGGPVVSHLKIFERPEEVSAKVAAGGADCYLGFDVLVATSPSNLDHARSDKTIAVVSTSQVPTGAMVTHTDVHFPDAAGLLASVNRCTRKDENAFLDALGLAETLFDDHMAANLIVLGAAYQAGAIPVAAEAIERAITLNGVSVAMNTQAFRVGRLVVADPTWATTLKRKRVGAVETAAPLTAEARGLVDTVAAADETRRLLEIRVPELIDYQDAAYARRYVDVVRRVVDAERRVAPGRTALSQAVARYLFKLMAYKDEYEVARLHLKSDFAAALKDEYPGGVTVQYNLHPPLLRALGWQRKIRFGRWFDSVFRALHAMRGVRGGALDVFGWPEVRRVERALIGEYTALIDKALVRLDAASYDKAVKLAALPDLVRGYEDIKLANVRRFREEVRALGF
jgi:indolepyruvate ferredoxin oxidoreductase